MAKVLTIYCIGSGHDYSEKYNTLVELMNQTKVDTYKFLLRRNPESTGYFDCELFPLTGKKPLALPDNWVDIAKNNLAVLVDGVTGDIISDETAGKYINDAVNKLQTQVATIFKPDIINMVGHSRGAITTLMMAWSTLKTDYGKKDGFKFNTFLIDPVKHADIPSSKGLCVPKNVVNYRRIIMEDDGGNTPFDNIDTYLFPLETITFSDDHDFPNTVNVRMPGTHGTATQRTPLALEGKKLPESGKGQTWAPIGDVAFMTIVRFLIPRSTGFKVYFTDYNLIDAYARIFTVNKSKTKGIVGINDSHNRLVNDVGNSSPNQKQKYNWIEPSRSKNELNDIISNPYRWGVFFINMQHQILFNDNFANFAKALPPYNTLGGSYVKVLLTAHDKSNPSISRLQWIQEQFHQNVENFGRQDFNAFYESLVELEKYCPAMFLQLRKYLRITATDLSDWKDYYEL